MSDNPLARSTAVSQEAPAPLGDAPPSAESLPSEAMQAEEEGRGFKPQTSSETLRKLKEERESETARTLSLTLVWVLVGVFVIHYGLLTYLGISHAQVIPSLEHVFNTAFPVFSGLVGTAVGFYLKERK